MQHTETDIDVKTIKSPSSYRKINQKTRNRKFSRKGKIATNKNLFQTKFRTEFI